MYIDTKSKEFSRHIEEDLESSLRRVVQNLIILSKRIASNAEALIKI